MKKSELKTGMLVKMRNGEYCTVMISDYYESISRPEWFMRLSSYTEDLLSAYSEEYDIVEIRTPHDAYCSQFEFMEDYIKSWFKLIWERKETEELTLEQVCKELGREIKIVK